MMTNYKNTGKSPVKLLLILPVATLLFITMAAFNGISADEMRNTGADEIPVLKNASDLPLVVDLPQDTIKKKTIIKKVSKENPTDTVIIEKEVIIIGNDKDMQHSGGGRRVHIIDGDGRERHTGDRDVIVHSHDNSDEEEVDVFIERSGRHSDSLKHVEIITHGGDKNGEKVIIRHRSGDESDVLYIVDGEKMTDKSAIEILNPDEIQSMSVIKGEDAAKYGENYSGVIIITTKKPKK